MQKTQKEENGAVLVLIALMLIAIFGFAALATELTQYSTAVAQARNSANLAALGAIEEASSFDSTAPITNVLSKATLRAQVVSGLNFTLAQSAPERIEMNNSNLPQLKAGRWYYARPPTGDPCGSAYPCFVDGATQTNRPNAFRVVGNLYQPFPFHFARTAFGSGAASLPIKVSSTATIVPRRGCFLVDITPTTFSRTTHALSSSSASFGDIAYAIEDDNPTIGPLAEDTIWDRLRTGGKPEVRDSAPSSSTTTAHFQSDYDLSNTVIPGGVVADSDYNSDPDFAKYHHNPNSPVSNSIYTNGTKWNYRLDMFPRPSSTTNGYIGPEPMNTVFQGLLAAVNEYQKRAVVGDQMCLVFFDRKIDWSRTINLTSDFTYLKKLVDPAAWPNRTAWLLNLYRLKIFPRISSQTDMQVALTEAVNQFDTAKAANPGMPSSDFIVLIGSGLQNCYDCAPSATPLPFFDVNNDRRINSTDKAAFDICFTSGGSNCLWADSNGDGYVKNDIADKIAFDRLYNDPKSVCTDSARVCSTSYLHYDMGARQLVNFVQSDIYPKKIPIHVIQLGAIFQPYTIEYEDPNSGTPKKCFSQYDNRVKGYPVVNGIGQPSGCTPNRTTNTIVCDATREASFNNRSVDAPFTEVNTAMFQIAAMTGGLWGPLRPTASGCTPGVQTCTPGKNIYDPKCRSVQTQMTDYVKEIMGQNPFSIVEQ